MVKISLINMFLALFFAPLFSGVINRVKAFFGGRKGQPLLQLYYDLFKLLNKGVVYSVTTTWVFRAAPPAGLAAIILAACFVPYGKVPALLSFNGDIIFFAYLLALIRFLIVIAALDTGSSFEGMGAAREIQFAVFAEPVFFLSFVSLAKETGNLSLSGIYSALSIERWGSAYPVLLLIASALFVIFLSENSRVPVDDPNTHLELTMIHEAMILDHSGPDLAFILYGSALKFFVSGALFIGIINPLDAGNSWINMGMFFTAMMCLAVSVGAVESVMARFRLLRIPQLLIGALSLSILAFIFQIR
jgi:formate hydrogenlyase subunit 4